MQPLSYARGTLEEPVAIGVFRGDLDAALARSDWAKGGRLRYDDRGYLAMGGQIVDATVIEARRPRLSAGEKTTIKGAGVPAHWSKAKWAQMDRDGRWTLKRGRRKPCSNSSARTATVGSSYRLGQHGDLLPKAPPPHNAHHHHHHPGRASTTPPRPATEKHEPRSNTPADHRSLPTRIFRPALLGNFRRC